jgi:hypothetical protein
MLDYCFLLQLCNPLQEHASRHSLRVLNCFLLLIDNHIVAIHIGNNVELAQVLPLLDDYWIKLSKSLNITLDVIVVFLLGQVDLQTFRLYIV